jgi:hypothetical protein
MSRELDAFLHFLFYAGYVVGGIRTPGTSLLAGYF